MKVTEVTAGLAESNGSLLPGLWRDSLHVTCGLTACTPGSAPGPTLGNEYGKTLPFYTVSTHQREPGERDNARNTARCRVHAGEDGQHQDVEYAVGMTEDRDKWSKYVHGNGQSREPALCLLYLHTFVPYTYGDSDVIWFHIYASLFLPPSCRYNS